MADKLLPVRAEGTRTIGVPPARVFEVLHSPIFQRMTVGFGIERTTLWRHLRDSSNLSGDPARWTVSAPVATVTNRVSDGSRTWPLPSDFVRITLIPQSENFWWLRIRKVFDFNYSMRVGTFEPHGPDSAKRIHYTIRKSASFGNSPDTAFIWRLHDTEDGVVHVSLMIRADSPVPDSTPSLLHLLHEVCLMQDLAPIREEQKKKKEEAEVKRKQEEERRIQAEREKEERRREQERLAANRAIAQERADQRRRERDRVLQLLDQDLCLKCERPVVMRRNKSNGHLFFGCSNFVSRKCRGVRDITCPRCHSKMIEKKSKSGDEFLGCPRWPKCTGSRSIDLDLKAASWAGRNDYSDVYSMDDFAQDMGYDTWAQFARDNNVD